MYILQMLVCSTCIGWCCNSDSYMSLCSRGWWSEAAVWRSTKSIQHASHPLTTSWFESLLPLFGRRCLGSLCTSLRYSWGSEPRFVNCTSFPCLYFRLHGTWSMEPWYQTICSGETGYGSWSGQFCYQDCEFGQLSHGFRQCPWDECLSGVSCGQQVVNSDHFGRYECKGSGTRFSWANTSLVWSTICFAVTPGIKIFLWDSGWT